MKTYDKHTPAPWHFFDGCDGIEEGEEPTLPYIEAGEGDETTVICDLYLVDEVVANGRLIKAAPELLEFIEWVGESKFHAQTIEDLRKQFNHVQKQAREIFKQFTKKSTI